MGKGKGRGGELTDHCVTFSVLILNVFCGILGALIFSLAIWFRTEGKVRTWVNDLEMYQYWTGLYILMAAGAIIIFISICGCVGAVQSNACLLATSVILSSLSLVLILFGSVILLHNYTRPTMDMEKMRSQFEYVLTRDNYAADNFLIFLHYESAVLILVALILELAGGIYIIVHGTQASKLSPWLDRKFSRLVVDSNYDTRALDLMSNIQENVGCCGSYNYQDYQRNRLPIPASCRDKVTGNVHNDGCVRRFAAFIEKRTGWISGIALFIGLLQIILVCLTFIYWKRERDEQDADVYGGTKYSGVPSSNVRYNN